ncbi:MAG: LysM peptidoglycan-binding domain-containing protein [Puniceicoccales bacterium]|jgi:LysM repeat protein|nr:LysM peptidoglycan-binding domain-containing protein [Puniceicoccales bacterium]
MFEFAKQIITILGGFAAMKFQNILGICVLTSLVLLGGCSFFDDSTRKKEDNVAYFIAPEVASNGATPRKKPTQPKKEDGVLSEDFGNDRRSQSEAIDPEKAVNSTYVVQSGDSVYGVARQFGMPATALMELNGLSRDSQLKVGQKLNVDRGAYEAKKKTVVYEVQSGDSLSRIARMFGISVKALREANVLQSDMLVIGQRLNIPVEPRVLRKLGLSQSGERRVLDADGRYTVKHGDSISLIAKYFGVKRADLQSANGIYDPDKLQIGQKLVIPPKSSDAQNATDGQRRDTTSSRVGRVSAEDMYVIKSGDTIGQIAEDLGVAERDLIELNNLDGMSSLQVGKKLLVPHEKVGVEQKTAQKGVDFFDSFDEIPVIEVNN